MAEARTSNDVDPLTLAQWNGVFLCRFVPDEVTERELGVSSTRKFHWRVPRQSYLPFMTTTVVEHYFGENKDVQKLRVTYQMVVPSTSSSTDVPEEKQGSGGGGSSGTVVSVSEFYPIGVLVDSILGKREEYGVIQLQFRISGAAPESTGVLGLTIADSTQSMLRNLHQQQKGACVALFGSNGAYMKLAPRTVQQLDDAILSNDVRSYYQARNIMVQNGFQDVLRSTQNAYMADLALFVFHKDNAVGSRVVSVTHCPTLGHVLKTCVSCFKDLQEHEIDNKPASAGVATVLLTGVEPSLCTPTEFLRDWMGCADCAVHITIVQPKESKAPRGLEPAINWKMIASASVVKNGSMASPMGGLDALVA